jgi:hypothetical protein
LCAVQFARVVKNHGNIVGERRGNGKRESIAPVLDSIDNR